MYKKNRFFLHLNEDSRFIDAVTGREFLSVKLLSLAVTEDTAKWTMEFSRGGNYIGLTEGSIGSSRPLPVDEECWVAMAIPLVLHKKKGSKQFSPDFIFNLPGNIILEVQ